MEKKIIKIFIASSIVELHDERNDLDSFLRRLGSKLCERYVEKGIYINIEPIRCEDVDPAISGGRMQSAIDTLLGECEVCVFLFFTRAGEYTIEEFDSALKAFRASKNGRPKIYTFFKRAGGTVEQSVTDFMNRLDKDLQHYYTVFDSIDTVKLQLLLHLSILNSEFVEVVYENGNCYVNGEKELDVAHVSQFANNSTLQEYLSELGEVEKEYFRLKGSYPFESEETNATYRNLAVRRQVLTESIEVLKKDIYNMTLAICKDEASGKPITVRMREAYRLFERGDLDGANRILNYEEIRDEYLRRKKAREDEQKKDDALYVRELRAKIRFLKADAKNPNRHSELSVIFEDAVSVAKKSLVELGVLIDHIDYLEEQGQTQKAFEEAKALEQLYESGAAEADPVEQGKLLNLLSVICYHFYDRRTEAEGYCKKAIEIFEGLSSKAPGRYDADLAENYQNAGHIFDKPGMQDTVEQFLLKSFSIREKLAAEDPERYEGWLADGHHSLSVFYYNHHENAKGLEAALKGIAIREKLAAKDPERFEPALADSCFNLGASYNAQGDAKKAEEYHLRAITIREKLVMENPLRYSEALARSYNPVAWFYLSQNQTKKADEFSLKAIAIADGLLSADPKMYSGIVADIYTEQGLNYAEQKEPWKAESFLLKALPLYEKMCEVDPERFRDKLANGYASLALFYDKNGSVDRAEEYYSKAASIEEELAGKDPDRYGGTLAVCYNGLGNVYTKRGEKEKAENYYLKSLELAEKNSMRSLAVAYNNLGWFYDSFGDTEKAEAQYLKAIAIQEKLVADNPEEYSGDLATNYRNLAVIYEKQGKSAEAEEKYLQAIAIREKLYEENPRRYAEALAGDYRCMGSFYYNLGQWEKAEPYYRKELEVGKSYAANVDLVKRYDFLAKEYEKKGMVDKAEECLLKALEKKESFGLGLDSERAVRYDKLGKFYATYRRWGLAKKYYKKAIELYTENDSYLPFRLRAQKSISDNVAKAFVGLGTVYGSCGESFNRKSCFLQAIALGKVRAKEGLIDGPEKLVSLYIEIATHYLGVKKRRAAKKYYRMAIATSEKLVAEDPEDSERISISAICYWLYAEAAKSEKYYDMAYELAKKAPDESLSKSIIEKYAKRQTAAEKRL